MSFVDNAIEAVMGNDKFQSYVRETIIAAHTDSSSSRVNTAIELADKVTEFRRAIEPWVQDPKFKHEVADRRKKVNNIINDTARICRELLGYTIKCTSRKNHQYGVDRIEVKAKPMPTDALPVTEGEPITVGAVPYAVKRQIVIEALQETPRECISTLINEHGAEVVGKMVASLLRGEA